MENYGFATPGLGSRRWGYPGLWICDPSCSVWQVESTWRLDV